MRILIQKYHLRRTDKKINDLKEIQKIIQNQDFLTLALCKDNTPYIVSLNYGYDANTSCFYFHCAKEGKKIDFLEANPEVYGQILEQLKYKEGECAYAYRSVQFEGTVSFLQDTNEKKQALNLLIDSIENPELINKTKQKFVTTSATEKVHIGKISIKEISGKEERL